MDALKIRGGNTLRGTIRISGSKNATLPLMTACLLTDEVLTLNNLPHLADVTTLAGVLQELGVGVHIDGTYSETGASERSIALKASSLTSTKAPYDLVRKMRASILVLGPLVARHGQASVSLPGGCAIGTRPVDMHIEGLRKLGAEIVVDNGYIEAKAPNGLTGAEFTFDKTSVTGTENILMAATLAKGITVLRNAAREPEVTDLAKCLNAMGAKITGLGTDTLRIEGVDRLHAATHSILIDRIEAGSYAVAAAITGGDVNLIGADPENLPSFLQKLENAGVSWASIDGGMRVWRDKPLKSVDFETEPFPGFATDLQAQFMALMTVADGASLITESIFENRFMHVQELERLGADITITSNTALIRSVPELHGAPVMATDLRASMSLVIAALVAKGETIINRIYHLDRGYEHLEEKLANCGADIERIRGV